MTRAHGDRNRYLRGPDENDQPDKGCRCEKCRTADRRERKLHRLAVVRGLARPEVEAEPVRVHAQALCAAGMTRQAIAREAGVAHSLLSRLILGDARTGHPVKTVRACSADAILAVRADPTTWLMVPATGVQRRLRALAWKGWTPKVIAGHVGLAEQHVWRLTVGSADVRVSAAVAARVLGACRRLHIADPVVGGVEPWRAAVAHRRAVAAGWVPLAAWDAIDDPDAVPDLGEPADQALALLEDSDWLIAQGYTIERAAERMGLPASTLGATRLRTKAKLAAPPAPRKKITRKRVPKKALHLLLESERLRADGLSIPVIAAQFGISRAYLKAARNRARKHLAEFAEAAS